MRLSTATRSRSRLRRACRTRSWRRCPTRWSLWCVATPAPTGPSRPARSPAATPSTRRPRFASSSERRRWSAASCVRVARSESGAIPTFFVACGGRAWRICGPRPRRWTPSSWPGSCPAGRTSTPTAQPAPGRTASARRSSRFRASLSRPTSGSATCCRGGWGRIALRGSTSSAPVARWFGSAPGRWAAAAARWRCTSARMCVWPARHPPAPRSRLPRARPTTRFETCSSSDPASGSIWSAISSCRSRSSTVPCGTWRGRAR